MADSAERDGEGKLVAALAGAGLVSALALARSAPLREALVGFHRRYDQALHDEQLRRNLLAFQRFWRRTRDASFPTAGEPGGDGRRVGVPLDVPPIHADIEPVDFWEGRRKLAAVKDAVRADLSAYVRQFKEAAERAGAVVYEARTAEEANRYIVDLARRRGVSLVVKSKSMVSEEIGLGHELEAAGIRPVETDLGEWIVQLAGERPSHMVAPAVHKSRYQVADLFNKKFGLNLSGQDIPELTAVARKELREAFLSATMGISGANALIAESGTAMVVTNEGNGRLVTTLPPVHVVLAGYEKIIPRFEDAVLMQRLLPRSAASQHISSYTTFVTGPDRPGREVHIVLLDNGRSRMREDPDFAETLRCVRCGACANVCPAYQVVGGHVFGYIYTGAIGLVNTQFHHGLENATGPQSLCVSCNACARVCPVEIPLPRQILDVRKRVVDEYGLPVHKRLAMEIWSRPRLFDMAIRNASFLAAPLAQDGLLRHLPLPESFAWRTPPAPALRPARDRLGRRPRVPARVPALATGPARGLTVAYFIQCITDRFLPEVAEDVVRVLEACGTRVVVPKGQHCCGLPAHDAGDRASALRMAKHTVRILESVKADYIVTGAASCVAAIVHDYPHIFAGDPVWLARAELVASRVLDLTTFVDRVAAVPDGALAGGGSFPVTYHNFCQSNNVLGIRYQPRRLIEKVMGLQLREMDESAVCCGFGGSSSIDHPGVAKHIAARKLENIEATGAPVLVTDNPGCILHLRGSIDAAGRDIKVMHVAELLARRIKGEI